MCGYISYIILQIHTWKAVTIVCVLINHGYDINMKVYNLGCIIKYLYADKCIGLSPSSSCKRKNHHEIRGAGLVLKNINLLFDHNEHW